MVNVEKKVYNSENLKIVYYHFLGRMNRTKMSVSNKSVNDIKQILKPNNAVLDGIYYLKDNSITVVNVRNITKQDIKDNLLSITDIYDAIKNGDVI